MTDLLGFLLSLPGILIALVIHEFAHGWVADFLGDPTPRNQGRLTLNPLKHLDPLGTLMLVVAKFGWAKPVPVNPLYFRGNRRRGMVWVSLAGPLANLVLAFLVTLGMGLILSLAKIPGWVGSLWQFTIIINVYLGLFNLLPIPPLDGSKILMGLLPPASAWKFSRLEPYGPLILILAILSREIIGLDILAPLRLGATLLINFYFGLVGIIF